MGSFEGRKKLNFKDLERDCRKNRSRFRLSRSRIAQLRERRTMRETIVLLTLCLCACASPRVLGEGDLTLVAGAPAAGYSGSANGRDAPYVQAIQDGVLERLGASRSEGPPRFLVQVGVARSLESVGVSNAAGALDPEAWRLGQDSEPWWRFWAMPEGKRAVTLAVIDIRDGKTIAWSSIRVREEPPATVADRLLGALQGPGRRALRTP
jgi:hypothetical protein